MGVVPIKTFGMEFLPNDLSFLFVSEAVREFEKKYDGMKNKNLHIEASIYNFGKKPGFAFTALLLKNEKKKLADLPKDCGVFFTKKLSPKIFGKRPTTTFENQTMTIKFERLPAFIECLTSPDGTFNEQQKFWYECYTNFMAGVYAGSLSHFGYNVRMIPQPLNAKHLIFKFILEPLEGAWTFSTTQLH